jgi:hypothetical protein
VVIALVSQPRSLIVIASRTAESTHFDEVRESSMLRRVLVVITVCAAVAASTTGARADVLHNLNMANVASANGVATPGATYGIFNLGPALTPSVHQWEVTARSFVGFKDVDGSGTITANDTFKDYVALNVSGFTKLGGTPGDLTPSRYGNSPGIPDGMGGFIDPPDTHEITVLAELSGKQTSSNTFVLTSIDSLQFYFDFQGKMVPFTFADINNLNTYADGVNVETGGPLIAGAGNNSNAVSVNGDITLFFPLIQQFANFESNFFDEMGNPIVPTQLIGKATLNNNLTAAFNPTGLANYFSFNFGAATPGSVFGPGSYAGGDFSFGFTTTSGGQFIKLAGPDEIEVPEPASMLVWGVGMGIAGVMGLRRRRNKAKA